MFKIIPLEETIQYKQLQVLRAFREYLRPFLKYKSFQKLVKSYYNIQRSYQWGKFEFRCYPLPSVYGDNKHGYLDYRYYPTVEIAEKTPQALFDAITHEILERENHKSEAYPFISDYQLKRNIEQYSHYDYTQEKFDACKELTIKELEAFLVKLKAWDGGEIWKQLKTCQH